MSTDDTNAARRGSGSNDLLGQAPERAGWTQDRPNAGGRWMWASGGLAPVALRLTDSGAEVAPPDDDDDFDGTPQYYWEQTPTDQKHMPGWWKRA